MLFHLFSLIDRLFLSCTVGEPHIRSNNCFISNRLRFINAWFCWHYAIIAADKSHLMAVTSSSMTIQFNVSFQKEKMTILLSCIIHTTNTCSSFVLCLSILYSCKSSVFTASTLKEFFYHTRTVFCCCMYHSFTWLEVQGKNKHL